MCFPWKTQSDFSNKGHKTFQPESQTERPEVSGKLVSTTTRQNIMTSEDPSIMVAGGRQAATWRFCPQSKWASTTTGTKLGWLEDWVQPVHPSVKAPGCTEAGPRLRGQADKLPQGDGDAHGSPGPGGTCPPVCLPLDASVLDHGAMTGGEARGGVYADKTHRLPKWCCATCLLISNSGLWLPGDSVRK